MTCMVSAKPISMKKIVGFLLNAYNIIFFFPNVFLADPLTVFAPTNDAFARIDSNDLNRLLASPERLIGENLQFIYKLET